MELKAARVEVFNLSYNCGLPGVSFDTRSSGLRSPLFHAVSYLGSEKEPLDFPSPPAQNPAR